MNIEFLITISEYCVFGILGFMSFLSLLFYIERLMYFSNIKLEEIKENEELEIALTNNINIISTIGSNAPYIGLLGTVFGIIFTFYTIGQNVSFDVKDIMISLSLALKATALGLGVAIPSMIFYNHLSRKIEVLQLKWKMISRKVYES